jgi:hypothetical protein
MSMGAAVAVILVKERQLVDAFVAAGATEASRAVPPGDVGMDPTRVAARRLLSRGIIRETGRGTYYLDLQGWFAMHRRRQRLAVALLLVIALAFAVLVLVPQLATRSP